MNSVYFRNSIPSGFAKKKKKNCDSFLLNQHKEESSSPVD